MKTDVRGKILKKAADLFYRQGYNSTGINQIIDESDIARASLYHHFESKSELLYAYLEEFNDEWFTQLHLHLDKIKDPKDKLLGIFDFRMKRQVVANFGGCPFVKAGAEVQPDDKRAFEIIDKNKMKLRALITGLVAKVSRKGRGLSTEELADALYLMMEGATVTASFQKSKSMMLRARVIADRMI